MKFTLEANGFDVDYLGIDVFAERFIKNIKEFKPKILALSGFSMFASESMKEVIQKIKEVGLRDSVTIIINEFAIDENIVNYVGADHFLRDIISPNFT